MPDVTPPADPPPPPPNPPPRTAFEWSLSALRPADADVARPSFMYKAGQASRDKAVRFWRAAAVVGALLTLGVVGGAALAIMLMMTALVQDRRPRAEPMVFETPAATVPEAPPEPPARPLVPYPLEVARPTDPTPAEIAAALARRREVLVGGLGLLPQTPPPAPGPDRPLTPNTGVFAAPR